LCVLFYVGAALIIPIDQHHMPLESTEESLLHKTEARRELDKGYKMPLLKIGLMH
jgi:hypothetical protein